MKRGLVLGIGLVVSGIFVGCGGGDPSLPTGGSSSSSSGGGEAGTGGNGGTAGSGGGMAGGGGGTAGSGGGMAGSGGMGSGGGTAGMGGMGGGVGGMAGGGGGPVGNCGNATVDYMQGEECDDGNLANGDGCSAMCKIEAAATCGDGKVDIVNAEECDDGNNLAGDGCSPACQLEMVGQACGNNMTVAPEVCDDGNTASGDGCNATCNSKETSTLFVGSPGQGGAADGIGTAARISGAGTLAADVTTLWFGDQAARTLRRIDIATATVTTVAGMAGVGAGYVDNPTGTNARFGNVGPLTTDGTTIWVVDGPNHVIRAVTATAPYSVTTVAGSGNAGMIMDGIGAAAQFDDARGLTYYKGLVYMVDANAAVVRTFDPVTKEVKTIAGTPYMKGATDGIGAAARFQSPRYIANDGSGMLYIADTNGNTIRAFNTVTNEVTTFAGDATCGYVDGTGTATKIHRPRGMTSDGTSIYWVEFNAHTIRQGVVATKQIGTFSGTPLPCSITCSCGMNPPPGTYVEGVGAAARWNGPWDIAFHWPSNSFFVVDGGNFVIRRIQ